MGAGGSVVNAIMGVKQLNFAREQFEAQRPILEARQKLLNAQAKEADLRLKLMKEFSAGPPGQQVSALSNQINEKVQELLLSGVGQMGQLTGQDGMGITDMIAQSQVPALQEQMQQPPQQTGVSDMAPRRQMIGNFLGFDASDVMRNEETRANNLRVDEDRDLMRGLKEREFELEEKKHQAKVEEIEWKDLKIDGVEYEVPYYKSTYGRDGNLRVPGMEPRLKGKTDIQVKKDKGKKDVSNQVRAMGDIYLKLDRLGGMVNVQNNTWENILASASVSPVGQTIGKWMGTDVQSLRNTIETQRPAMINAIRQATGMGAKQMDSDKELQFYLQTVSSTDVDIQSNLAALAILDEVYGDGTFKEHLRSNGNNDVLQRIDDIERHGKTLSNNTGKTKLKYDTKGKLIP